MLLLFAAVEGQRTLNEEVAQTLRILGVEQIEFLLLGQQETVLQSLQDLVVLSVHELVVDRVDLVRKVRRQKV